LNTDIAGAHNVGLRTALMLTGVATQADLATSHVQPDAVYADLPALIAAWA
ncbi:MAG: HAD hydrolase-like protein, partial [Anaerolineae bacterium]